MKALVYWVVLLSNPCPFILASLRLNRNLWELFHDSCCLFVCFDCQMCQIFIFMRYVLSSCKNKTNKQTITNRISKLNLCKNYASANDARSESVNLCTTTQLFQSQMAQKMIFTLKEMKRKESIFVSIVETMENV